jgi:hypothetical protein
MKQVSVGRLEAVLAAAAERPPSNEGSPSGPRAVTRRFEAKLRYSRRGGRWDLPSPDDIGERRDQSQPNASSFGVQTQLWGRQLAEGIWTLLNGIPCHMRILLGGRLRLLAESHPRERQLPGSPSVNS